MQMMSLDEIPKALALLDRIKNKDESAIEMLRQFMGKRIYCFAFNRLHDEMEAESVVSETLFAIWEKPQAYQGASRLSTWVYGVAKFKVLDVLRKRAPKAEDIEDFSDELACESLGPFDVLAKHQYQNQILGCIDTLPSVQSECLHLTYFEDWSVTEIAQFQQAPEGTIKSRLFLARKAMKICLENGLVREAQNPEFSLID
jgi:RNA polymerase sigma-70 factor, ECF subfamily